jgi:asparagine synthase (glutamine-hydrolysing)
MCGISCIISHKQLQSGTLEGFTDAVRHRGPDGHGIAKFAITDTIERQPDHTDTFFIGLGHRRLSILDLSEAGAQPMTSSDNSCVISYNGEVYNYIELREELKKKGMKFQSHCDTEVVLAAYQIWGTECFKRFNGMWSMVILDRIKREIIVSRDRLGIKPLYYFRENGLLAFASEIKQFTKLPGFQKSPNKDACIAYLVNGYEIPPETFWKGVYSFPSANFARISLKNENLDFTPQAYWSPEKIVIEKYSPEEAIQMIDKLFYDAVRLRLRSDVPVGSCLSGGLDSSSIFINMGKLEQGVEFTAFSACFEDRDADERVFMEEIVKNTKSYHAKIFPENIDLADDFDKLLFQHDEPIGSASIYAQYRVMKEAGKQNVPVLLDGQGADELFSGYWQTYFLLLDRYRKNGYYGDVLAHLTSALLPSGNYQLVTESFAGICEFRKRSGLKFEFEINKGMLADIANSSTSYDNVRNMSPEEYRIHELMDLRLPRLLKWEDRNSMAFSIESRVPFLDINLIEFLLSIPPEMNMKKGWTKYLFRKAMSEKLPKMICWRKDKKGFETPQEKWMKSGAFHELLLSWANRKEHPVSDYISTSFNEINSSIKSKNFDSTSMFRLFCLDKWLSQ